MPNRQIEGSCLDPDRGKVPLQEGIRVDKVGYGMGEKRHVLPP
jgi:hypothetical protein